MQTDGLHPLGICALVERSIIERVNKNNPEWPDDQDLYDHFLLESLGVI